MSSEISSLVRTEPMATPVGTLPAEQLVKSRENPERLAWIVLLGSFAVFLVLAVTLPMTARYIIRYATVSQQARLEPTLGTLFFYPSLSAEAVAVTGAKEGIGEGSRIVAAEDSTQGSLAFISDDDTGIVLGSVQIYAGTALDVVRIRRPFFASSTEPYYVRLHLAKGQARIFSNSEQTDVRPLRVELETPHGVIELDAGSYQVSVSEEQTDITVRSGRALLTHQMDGVIAIEAEESAWMTANDFAHDPESVERNLLRNGDFSEPELDAWQAQPIADGVKPGTVQVYEREGRWVAHFMRDGEENVNNEVRITQVVERDVNVYDDLSIQLDVKLLHQSLSGAGYLSSEYPLRVEITYTDIYGKVLTWGHGFYYRDPEDKNWKILDGEKIPPYIWYTYQSPNLMELLADTRPARINSVRIYASGWNYQSMVSEVYLVAK
jgi:hypothetical protein